MDLNAMCAVAQRHPDRRGDGQDRRKQTRGGRRLADPRNSTWRWRRLAWLFAAYGLYVGVRSLPAIVKRWPDGIRSRWKRTPS
jgi:hypothetical protein